MKYFLRNNVKVVEICKLWVKLLEKFKLLDVSSYDRRGVVYSTAFYIFSLMLIINENRSQIDTFCVDYLFTDYVKAVGY